MIASDSQIAWLTVEIDEIHDHIATLDSEVLDLHIKARDLQRVLDTLTTQPKGITL
jgi:hypothetical protein